MLELSRLPAVPADKRASYRRAAERTLFDLSDTTRPNPYRETSAESDPTRETILLRATTTYKGPSNILNTDVEKGLVYADYFFVEALLRDKDMYGDSPCAPGFLTGRREASGVTLDWRATRGARAYRVKCATGSGGPYALVAVVEDPRYVETGAAAGTAGFCVVTAVNQVDKESGGSNEVEIPGR
jgi:hypothetical protein